MPALVDLAAMRDAMTDLGGNPGRVNPVIPAELVTDHSVIADYFGRPDARDLNVALEYERNNERYRFLKWGQGSFDRLKVVPPGMGIMHQVNIEYLARVVETDGDCAYPDLCLGTDSHTTMVNGLGVLGWGIGGIEAESSMLGRPAVDRAPRRPRVPSHRRAATRRHRHRPRAHRHRDAPPARCCRQVRGVPRSRGGQDQRCGPGDHRQHGPKFGSTRAVFRSTTRRCAICGSPAAMLITSNWSRPTPRPRVCGMSRTCSSTTRTRSSST